ncbi:MAG TPA: pectate lyase [Kofleriaceae bacterium]|nr:pectate lyase [Kofleriaceae bacterium]
MLRKIVVGAVIVGGAALAFAATNRPSGYVTICKIGDTCSVPASTDVAFGAAGLFVHKVLNGSFTCSVATFGSDPAPSKSVKECSVPAGGGAPPPPPPQDPPPTPPPGSGITGSSCGTNGAETVVHETIRVTSGTFDGGCRRFTAGTELGTGDQDEGQDPVFRVENGATLRNVVIGANGADGIHVHNGGTIDNVRWLDVGEDALTVKTAGTVTIRNITGINADDKFFQINAASTVNVSNCIIRNAGKALRQNGGTTFRINVTFDRCDLNTMDEGIFRTDSSSSTARITNSRVHDAGSTCIGPWASCTSSNITQY